MRSEDLVGSRAVPRHPQPQARITILRDLESFCFVSFKVKILHKQRITKFALARARHYCDPTPLSQQSFPETHIKY